MATKMKRGKFHISLVAGWREVSGFAVDIGGFPFFVHRPLVRVDSALNGADAGLVESKDSWRVSDAVTGRSVFSGHAPTREIAIRWATERVKRHLPTYRQIVKDELARSGVVISPSYNGPEFWN